MEFDLLKEKTSIIKVIGVGGGGSNAVNHMYRQGIKGVEFVVCNTDAQALEMSPVPTKLQLGLSLTDGRGAGSIPEVGRNAAIENIEDLRKVLLENTKMVFITAGMGGGTGTGAAPIIAQTAREMGILTVGIVTIPFDFEGKKRKHQADEGIEALKNSVDTILIIRNEKLREMFGNLRLSEAFSHADNILTTAAKGIAEIITVTGYINVDFEDVKTAVHNSGVAIMGSSVAEGENRATKAVELALASPLLNDNNIKGARYILMNIASGSREVTMDEIGDITDYIQDQAGLTADIIWGNCHDESLGDKLSVTIIATGFKTRAEIGHEVEQAKSSAKTVRVLGVDEPVSESKISSEEKAKGKDQEIFEPVLIRKNDSNNPPSGQNDGSDRTFEFSFSNEQSAPEKNVSKSGNETDQDSPVVYDLHSHSLEDPTEEQFRKTRDRIARLKALNYRIGASGSISDMEKEPAYKRRNVKLENVPHSSENPVSRYTLSSEDEKKTEIKPHNSFLHDNVD
ncbi:MAG: cell division protein FtsZ [Bacteroidetes bacterium]|nr:MAG: cell division protein FtsZ [Bacteroidota bacterium]REK03494.1 MAG: cell division protein FtsZ [Bacteroidota bacterium]REK34799.1 MAG: cell division protein FtsZ [Bacteroidota bacterium]REK51321.1 MAG: cell division protein FtsZ [Bacteroidota bacterium]